jgi:membrane protein DedA with SNARE-associated domain
MLHSFALWLQPYTTWLSHTLVAGSALAPLLLLFLEESGIPLFIPGDAVLAFTGYRLSVTHIAPLWIAVIVAMMAVLGGSTVLFFVSRRWGHILVDKVGKFMFIKQKDIRRAEELFQRYGAWTIIIGRHIPGMRIPLTIFAGTAGMSYLVFIAATLVSTLFWVIIALNVGVHFGADIERVVRRHIGLTLIFAAIVLLTIIGFHIAGSYKRRHKTEA